MQSMDKWTILSLIKMHVNPSNICMTQALGKSMDWLHKAQIHCLHRTILLMDCPNPNFASNSVYQYLKWFLSCFIVCRHVEKSHLHSTPARTSPPVVKNPAYDYFPAASADSILFTKSSVHATGCKQNPSYILDATKPNLSPRFSSIKPNDEIAQVQNLAYAQVKPKSGPATIPSQGHTYDTVQFEKTTPFTKSSSQ